MNCLACGSDIHEDDKFCIECGASLTVSVPDGTQMKCPACGFTLPPIPVSFCQECGSRLETQKKPEVVASQTTTKTATATHYDSLGVATSASTRNIIRGMKGLFMSVGGWVVGTAVVTLVLSIPLAIIYGLGRLAEIILPWLSWISAILLLVNILVLIPLAFARKTRGLSAMGFALSSSAYALTAWFAGLLISLSIVGLWWTFGALAFFGIGPILVALVATLFSGAWLLLFELVFAIVLWWGASAISTFLASSAAKEDSWE